MGLRHSVDLHSTKVGFDAITTPTDLLDLHQRATDNLRNVCHNSQRVCCEVPDLNAQKINLPNMYKLY